MDDWRKVLEEEAEGMEAAAEAEGHVMVGFEWAMTAFRERDPQESGPRPHGLMRRVRIYLDARSNQRNFLEKAQAIRAALSECEGK